MKFSEAKQKVLEQLLAGGEDSDLENVRAATTIEELVCCLDELGFDLVEAYEFVLNAIIKD